MRIIIIHLLVAFLLGVHPTCYANKKSSPITKPTIKVALLLDTSNSMDGLINQAKAQLWDIINELSYAKCNGKSPNLQIALYAYGNDSFSINKGFIQQISPFTNDLDEISEDLFSLRTNGGNEYCGEVVQTSIQQLDWGKEKKDLKMIFIAGNEAFTQGKVHFKDAIADAVEKGITVNTIFCGNYHQGVSGSWLEGATLGKGEYMTIQKDKKIVHILTPYDGDILLLNKKLNKTYLYYGNSGATKYKKQTLQDENAIDVNEEIMVKRAVTKSSRLYTNASWDLVDAAADKEFSFDALDKSELPDFLQGKTKEEIKSYVKEQREKRKNIQTEINELNTKRKKYIKDKQRSSEGNKDLESAIVKAIKKQAKQKNYNW